MRYQKCQEKKKSCYKVEDFLQQVKQSPHRIFINAVPDFLNKKNIKFLFRVVSYSEIN